MTLDARTEVLARELRERLGRLPRVALADLPTPLQEMARLREALSGPRLFIKRDDLTGLATGGNKTRHLEFLLGEALTHDPDVLVTGASAQSNFCRQATAAAAKLGLEIQLVLFADEAVEWQGNLLLDHLLGAHIQLVPARTYTDEDVWPRTQALTERLLAEGRRPFRMTGYESICAAGYVLCATETVEQLAARRLRPDYVVLTSEGISQAGLALALERLVPDCQVLAIAPAHGEFGSGFAVRVAQELAGRLGLETQLTEERLPSYQAYVGERYGVPSPAGLEATALLARTEGILLDPTYTSKGFSGLVDLIRRGTFPHDAVVVFIHTGGIPILFAQAKRLMEAIPGAARGSMVLKAVKSRGTSGDPEARSLAPCSLSGAGSAW